MTPEVLKSFPSNKILSSTVVLWGVQGPSREGKHSFEATASEKLVSMRSALMEATY